jgi:hypothetical protein
VVFVSVGVGIDVFFILIDAFFGWVLIFGLFYVEILWLDLLVRFDCERFKYRKVGFTDVLSPIAAITKRRRGLSRNDYVSCYAPIIYITGRLRRGVHNEYYCFRKLIKTVRD